MNISRFNKPSFRFFWSSIEICFISSQIVIIMVRKRLYVRLTGPVEIKSANRYHGKYRNDALTIEKPAYEENEKNCALKIIAMSFWHVQPYSVKYDVFNPHKIICHKN